MAEKVSYGEIHAYMLKKTQEYYQEPPRILVEAVKAQYAVQGQVLSDREAKKLVSLIDIQRYIKTEMQARWPQFMSGIPDNPLKDR